MSGNHHILDAHNMTVPKVSKSYQNGTEEIPEHTSTALGIDCSQVYILNNRQEPKRSTCSFQPHP
jgi:hypothetical protein